MASASKKTLLFIPTYNEIHNVEAMCERLFALGLDADLLFIDDASPDGTGDALDRIASLRPRVTIVHRPKKAGIGSAHACGIAYAYDHGYARLVTLDCDFMHTPERIPELLARSADADVVVGSRFAPEGGLEGWNFIRSTLTSVGHALTAGMLGMKPDATAAFRVYDLTRIPRALFGLVRSRGYSFFFESLFMLHENGFRIAEVPVTLPARSEGQSKMTPVEVAYSVKLLATIFNARRTDPARFRLQPDPEIDAQLRDAQGWNSYWDEKDRSPSAIYDLLAYVYRNAVNKPRLQRAIHDEFAPGAQLLHAGCGSGQIDVDLHDVADITAVDISDSALRAYLRENPGRRVKHASIFDLPFPDATFDGAYNMGVVEHFTHDELARAFVEIRRVLKPGGKAVVFWPHARATSVKVIGAAHWMLNDVLHRNVHLHPPELSLVHSKDEASAILASGGLALDSYEFGARDLFVQALVVAHRPS